MPSDETTSKSHTQPAKAVGATEPEPDTRAEGVAERSGTQAVGALVGPDPATRSADRFGESVLRVVSLVAVLGFGLVLGRYAIGPDNDDDAAADAHDHEGQEWVCSMHPQIRMDKPGQCPLCGMDLIPDESALGDAGPAAPGVTLSANSRALAKIRTTAVLRTEPRAEVRLLGRVDYDETRLRMVTPWTDGRIDRLKVRVTGTKVRKGQIVAMLYSPEVYAAMRDLVVATKQVENLSEGMLGSRDLAAAAVSTARERLRLLGVSKSEIQSIERKREAPKLVPIRSSFSGTILERNVEEGDYVKAGTSLYHVADLSRVWVQIDAYESDLPHLATGQTVLIEIESLPDETFAGKVAFIDPIIDRATRTARVRVEVSNKSGQLRPGMFAQAVVEADIGKQRSHLVIPASAALFTGRRSVVYVELPGKPGTYELRETRLGPRAGPVFPVLAGLSEGERVVSNGAFIVDADLQLAGGRSMMTLGDDRDGAVESSVPVTAQMLEALKPVVTAYLDAQRMLAADDFDAAREDLEALATAVNAVELKGPRAARNAWKPIASALAGHGRIAAKSESDAGVRTAFEDVSAQIIAIVRTFGNPSPAPVHVAFCPMAFDSRGAQWVQDGEKIRNPYYGVAMSSCGDINMTVLPGERLALAGATLASATQATEG